MSVRYVRFFVAMSVIVLGWLSSSSVSAQGPVSDPQKEVSFEQHMGAVLPLDLLFRNEQGQSVTLRDYVHAKPIILTLNYFHCPNLCSVELNELTETLADLSFNLGDEYEVVSVSIDPRETPELAADTKWRYVRRYARPGKGEGWHFLTGTQPEIASLAQAVGFHYAYDPKSDEFAHPIGLIVLTPEGRIARYLYGLGYDPRDLRLALVEASQNKIGSLIDQILLICFHYDPANGKYSSIALTAARWSGVATVIVLAVLLGWLWRDDIRKMRQGL